MSGLPCHQRYPHIGLVGQPEGFAILNPKKVYHAVTITYVDSKWQPPT